MSTFRALGSTPSTREKMERKRQISYWRHTTKPTDLYCGEASVADLVEIEQNYKGIL